MKELSIEEKAQRFDEALQRTRKWYDSNTNEGFRRIFEDIFYELKESEGEESKKWIIEYLYDGLRKSDEQFKEQFKVAIAWLEKQGTKVSTIEGFETEFERQVSSLIASAINKEHEYDQGYVKWTANALLNYAKHELEKQGAPTEDELEALRIAAYEPTKNWSEKLQSLYEKLNHYEQGEQKSINNLSSQEAMDIAVAKCFEQGEQKSVKFKPLFKIGDVIKPKDPALGEPRIIKGIHPKFGYDTNDGILDFEFEDNWELVEQKLADKVEPKFHKGDWTVSNLDGKARKISEVYSDECNSYYMVNGMPVDIEEYDRLHHLWTIQDAKDGDVLVINNEIFIYAHRKQMYSIAVAHCFVDSAGGFYLDGEFGYTENGNSIHLATKEQRNTLEKAMTDRGYTFDFEKKELKKIEQKFNIGDEIKTANEEPLTITKIDEKGYWSENLFICSFDDAVKWELVEKKSSWSEEDKKMSRFIGNAITDDGASEYLKSKGIEVIDAHVWLEKLKDRVQPKQEWSEEDKDYYDAIITKLEITQDDASLTDNQMKFLKSLKERYTWKPSDEQMERLKGTINSLPHQEVLYSLYQDLKKLRGE